MNPDLFASYMSRLMDRDLSPDEFSQLEQYLESSPEARAEYLDYVDLHNVINLKLNNDGLPQLNTSNIIPIDKIIRRQKRRTLRVVALSTAAILMIGLLVMNLFSFDSDPPLTFKSAPGTQFTVTHSAALKEKPKELVLLKGSSLELTQGTIELTFESGVKSIIQAPAKITLKADDILYMRQGIAWFQVPPGAEGFQVNTADLNIVDLGTEFGVIAKAKDNDEIHVLKGKVNAQALNHKKEFATLSAGEARRVDPVGRLTTIPVKSSSFLTILPKSLPYIHWSFDEQDRFQATGNHPFVANIKTTQHSDPQLSPGKTGSALALNGKGQHLVTNWAGFEGNRARTIACWVRLQKDTQLLSYGGIAGWGDSSLSNGKWKIVVDKLKSTKKMVLRLSWGDHWINGTTDLADGKWHYIVATTTGEQSEQGSLQAELYVDGKQEPTSFHSDPTVLNKPRSPKLNTNNKTNNAVPLIIGSSLSRNIRSRTFFKGKIDELTIYDGHMTSEEVKQLSNP